MNYHLRILLVFVVGLAAMVAYFVLAVHGVHILLLLPFLVVGNVAMIYLASRPRYGDRS